jgi:predicted transcriptional regulator
MAKDAPIAFRIPNELKKRLQKVAMGEARSLSQICEMLLQLGVEDYESDGSKYLQRLLARQKKDGPSD